jgi:hypothetical protein
MASTPERRTYNINGARTRLVTVVADWDDVPVVDLTVNAEQCEIKDYLNWPIPERSPSPDYEPAEHGAYSDDDLETNAYDLPLTVDVEAEDSSEDSDELEFMEVEDVVEEIVEELWRRASQ